VAFFLTRFLDYAAFDLLFRLRGRPAAPALLRQIAGLLVFGICVALLFQLALSVSLTAVLATSAVITAVVVFALQDTLGNLFSGLALHLEKSVQVGDMVRSGETYGTVEELTWRAIKLRTVDGNVLLIPNSVASRERLEVFPAGPRAMARSLRVGLEYDLPPERAREILTAAARGVPGVASYPEPAAYLRSFEDFAVTYEVRYWLEDYSRFLDVDTQVKERAWYRLAREGVPIAYPLIRQHQYAAGPLPRPSHHEPVASAIAGLDLFAPLSAQEKEGLAQRALVKRYAPGETIVQEGERGSSMFLVQAGSVGVSIHGSAGDSRRLAVLQTGSAFGEISLLTGEPRTATVRCLTEATLVEIDKATLSPILEANPSLVESLDATIRERRKGAADLLDTMRAEPEKEPEKEPLSVRIARFFSLRGMPERDS
jgi:small-conductance mechanosensitive channel/CRP-like cAMP-binding protein